jgi:hypothetical protein
MTVPPLSTPEVWRSALSRCAGRSHRSTETPCQDQVFRTEYADGSVVVALADGAGSAQFSHYGADTVVRRASGWVMEHFDQLFRATSNAKQLRGQFVRDLQNELSRVARRGLRVTTSDRERLRLPSKSEQALVPCSIRDLASTLLLVAIRDDRYIAMHLGDGVVGIEIRGANGQLRTRVLGAPDNGEHANETQFVTSAKASERLRMYRGQIRTAKHELAGFILMSDGPEAVLYQKVTHALAPACTKLLQGCRDLSALDMQAQLTATLRDVIAPRTHDDCSLVLLAR